MLILCWKGKTCHLSILGQIMSLKLEDVGAQRSFIFLWCGSCEGLDLGREVSGCLMSLCVTTCSEWCLVRVIRCTHVSVAISLARCDDQISNHILDMLICLRCLLQSADCNFWKWTWAMHVPRSDRSSSTWLEEALHVLSTWKQWFFHVMGTSSVMNMLIMLVKTTCVIVAHVQHLLTCLP